MSAFPPVSQPKAVHSFVPDSSGVMGAGVWTYTDGTQRILKAVGGGLVEADQPAPKTRRPAGAGQDNRAPTERGRGAAPVAKPVPRQPVRKTMPVRRRPTPQPVHTASVGLVIALVSAAVLAMFTAYKVAQFRSAVLKDLDAAITAQNEAVQVAEQARKESAVLRVQLKEAQKKRGDIEMWQKAYGEMELQKKRAEEKVEQMRADFKQALEVIDNLEARLDRLSVHAPLVPDDLVDIPDPVIEEEKDELPLIEGSDTPPGVMESFLKRREKEREEAYKRGYSQRSGANARADQRRRNVNSLRAQADNLRYQISRWSAFNWGR